MIRSLTAGLLAILTLLAAGGAVQVAAASNTTDQLRIAVPSRVDAGSTAAITVSLPSGVAAVDGRIFFDTSNAEVAGVAPVGRGQALDPQQVSGGFAFGAYDMRASGGKNQIRIAVVANSAGRLPFRIVLDTAALYPGHAAIGPAGTAERFRSRACLTRPGLAADVEAIRGRSVAAAQLVLLAALVAAAC